MGPTPLQGEQSVAQLYRMPGVLGLILGPMPRGLCVGHGTREAQLPASQESEMCKLRKMLSQSFYAADSFLGKGSRPPGSETETGVLGGDGCGPRTLGGGLLDVAATTAEPGEPPGKRRFRLSSSQGGSRPWGG